MLTLLKSKRLITASEMAEKFGVSLRTIYRDIRKLVEAGVPVITEEGKGYSLMEGYTISPVQFQQEEVNALITAEKIIAKSKNQSLIQHFGNALVKIKSTFRGSMHIKSERLATNLFVLSTSKKRVENKSLSSLQMAMTNFLVVKIKYQKVNTGEISEREIEPVSIYSYDDIWIVIAWCQLRNDFRSFRLDKMLEHTVLSKQFEDRKFDIRAFFAACPEESIRNDLNLKSPSKMGK